MYGRGVEVKKIIVCGSISYNTIMEFSGHFHQEILPDQLHHLSMSFVADTCSSYKGGTGTNIAYNLALLGEKPILFGCIGKDSTEYREWFAKVGIDTSLLQVSANENTAICFTITDGLQNQIAGFYPGVMMKDVELGIRDLDEKQNILMLINPTYPPAMVKWVKECQELCIPYLFNPGLSLSSLHMDEITTGILGATIVMVNEYEYELVLSKTGLQEERILQQVEFVVVTRGHKGSILKRREETIVIPSAESIGVIDPTGAGDAYTAGFIKGYIHGASLQMMGSYGSVAAVYAIECKGCTEHSYTLNDFMQRLHRYNQMLGIE